jgi:serine/threonine protein kinase
LANARAPVCSTLPNRERERHANASSTSARVVGSRPTSNVGGVLRSSPRPARDRTPMNAPTVREGDILAGKYKVERVLGAGGMGVVVAAQHLQLHEKVALKFLHPELAQAGEAVGRFLREAQAAVRIKTEHVARVSDVGTLESGAPW